MKKIMNANISIEELDLLKCILDREGITAKPHLRAFIYKMEHKPDLEVGDIVIITDLQHSHFGYKVEDFVGKITESVIHYDGRKGETPECHYKVEYEYEVDGKVYNGSDYYWTNSLKSYNTIRKANCEYRINKLGKQKEKYEDAMSL